LVLEDENTPLRGKLHKASSAMVFVAPGNSGTEEIATNLNIAVTDFNAIKHAVVENNIEMVVVGPEDPLVQGIHDFFLNDDALKK
jgi:phosphoribosylamine--glycine ligase